MDNSTGIRKLACDATLVAGQPELRTAIWSRLMADRGNSVDELQLQKMQRQTLHKTHSEICAQILSKAKANGISSDAICATTFPRIVPETQISMCGQYGARDAQLAGGVSASAPGPFLPEFADHSLGECGGAEGSDSLPSALRPHPIQQLAVTAWYWLTNALTATTICAVIVFLTIHGPDIAQEVFQL